MLLYFLIHLFSSILFSHETSFGEYFESLIDQPKLVIEKKQLVFEDFPDAYNPSLVKVEDGYLLCFRYSPDRYSNAWLSYIGITLLDKNFKPIISPQLLNTRENHAKTQSQAEDARIFCYRNRIFVTYNDNTEVNYTSYFDRRDIYISEVIREGNRFRLFSPIKLFYENKRHLLWQKNWIPFEWNQNLMITYSINPHEILYANLTNGICYPCYETSFRDTWEFGILRGSTPPIIFEGEYLAFFHSGMITSSFASWGWDLWHYFMGAYTFSLEPPFEITKTTPLPIITEGFYTQSAREKRVIFPGGVIDEKDHLLIAYGKDDYEIWIATIDKKALKKALKPVKK